MNKKILPLLIVLLAASVSSFAQTNSAAGAATAGIVAATNQFLASLDEAQRRKVVFDFKDDAQRRRWSNLPNAIFKRQGLRMGDLTQPQREAVLGILAAAFSSQGYEKVLQIVDADELLKKSSGETMFGRDEYHISFLGQPSTSEPWMIQFGGHHLGLNITLVGEQRTLRPAIPARSPQFTSSMARRSARSATRPTKRSLCLARSTNRNGSRRSSASRCAIWCLGPGRDGQTIQPEGIKGSALSEKQRDMLLDLASEWTGILHEAAAKAKLDEMQKNIAETWFAWSGPTEKGSAAYFRIQGPTVVIEYAPQRLGGDATKHIHTIYRDPTNDYGVKWWKR